MKTLSSFVIVVVLLLGVVSNSVAENKATTGLYDNIQNLLAGATINEAGANMAIGIVFACLDEDKGNNVQISRDMLNSDNDFKKIFSTIAHYYENHQESRNMDQRTFVITALKGSYPAKNPALKGNPTGFGVLPIKKVWEFDKLPMQVRIRGANQVAMFDNMLFGYYIGIRNAENFIVPDEDSNVKNIVYNVILNYIKTHPESLLESKDTFLDPAQIAPSVVIKALEARYQRSN